MFCNLLELSMATTTAGIIMIVCSALSMVSSFLMCCVIIQHEKLLKKLSYQIFLCMAIANLLTACGSVVGSPNNGSFACWWEGILTNIFTLASIFWNVIFLIYIFQLCRSKPINMMAVHAYCWGIPTLVTLIPLYRFQYGKLDYTEDWCFIIDPTTQNETETVIIWYWMSFYIHIWIAIVAIAALTFYIYFKILFKLDGPTKMSLHTTLRKTKWYPIITIICWGLNCFVDTILPFLTPNIPVVISTIGDGLGCIQGFLVTIAFLSTIDLSSKHNHNSNSFLHRLKRGYPPFVPVKINIKQIVHSEVNEHAKIEASENEVSFNIKKNHEPQKLQIVQNSLEYKLFDIF